MLLEREDVNLNYVDPKYDRTPLLWAIRKGREGVIKVLLEREDVDFNYTYPESGATLLMMAAAMGFEGVVKMLLG